MRMGKLWQHEFEAVGHIASIVWKQEKREGWREEGKEGRKAMGEVGKNEHWQSVHLEREH